MTQLRILCCVYNIKEMNNKILHTAIHSRMRSISEVLVATGVVIGLGLLLYLSFLGTYNRPFQDDFYYYPPSNDIEKEVLLNERYHWTGRLSATTVHLIVGWAGVHWIIPLISFALMTTGTHCLLNSLLKNFAGPKKRSKWKVFVLSIGLVIAIFLVTPSPYSSIYWLSAAPIHFWSYGLILLYFSYLLSRMFNSRRALKVYDYAIMLGAPLIVGMLGEVAMATLLVGIVLIMGYAKLFRSKKILIPAVVNGVGVAGAFWALFFSIGAVIRRGAEGSIPVSEVIQQAPYVIVNNFISLMTSTLQNKELLIVVVLIALAIGIRYGAKRTLPVRKTVLLMGVVSIATVGLMSLNFVGVYASTRLMVAWDRTQAFSVISIVGLLLLCGVMGGVLLHQALAANYSLRRVIQNGAMIIAAGIVVGNAAYIPHIQRFSGFLTDRAYAYDQREEYINSTIKTNHQIQCPITLPATYLRETQEFLDLFPEQDHALNVGVQRYYRLPCGVVGE